MNKTERLLTQLTSIKNFINTLNKEEEASDHTDYVTKEVCNKRCKTKTDTGYHYALPDTDRCSEWCVFSFMDTGTDLDREFDSIVQQLKLIQLLEE